MRDLVMALVEDVVADRIEEIADKGQLDKERVSDLREVISLYPGTFTLPPSEAYLSMDILEIDSAPLREWMIDFYLWKEHKQSDFTLTCTAIEQQDGDLTIHLHDIRVL